MPPENSSSLVQKDGFLAALLIGFVMNAPKEARFIGPRLSALKPKLPAAFNNRGDISRREFDMRILL